MSRSRKCIALTLFISLVISSSTTLILAQQEDVSQLLSPLIDEHTCVILRIDLTRVDLDALYATAQQLQHPSENITPSPQDEAELQRMKQWLSQFTTAGGTTVYVLWGTANPLDILVAVPVAPQTNALTLNSFITEVLSDSWTDGQIKLTHKNNLILAGTSNALESWSQISPTVRPELQQAATTAGAGAIQLFLIPNIDSRRVIEALLPAVSEQQIVPETNAIVKGFQWAVLSIDLPPHTSLKMHIQSADSASAEALRNTLIKSYEVIGQLPQLQHIGPPLRHALMTLTPTVQGNTLRLTEEKKCIDLITNLIAPALDEARQTAERAACAKNLSGMGKAFLIYANDHDDKFPPNLETLVDTVEFPRKGLACPATRHNPDYSSYVYRGVDLKSTAVPPNLIVVHDRKGNHRDGRNVLFVDAHIDWVDEQNFADLIKRDNEIRQENNFKTKPAK